MESSPAVRPELPGRELGAAAELLARLDLPDSAELAELVDVGLATFVAAFDCGQPAIAADYLDFALVRVEAVVGTRLSPDQVAVALRSFLDGRLDGPALDPALRFVSAVLELATWATPRPPTDDELKPLARSFLSLSLAGRRDEARALVRQAVRGGSTVRSIVLDVLEPAQRELGRRWEVGQISIAQEHYSTAVTQQVLTDLEPLLFTGIDGGRRLVAVDAPGSLHQVGLRMVVDLLETEGWVTTYLGPTPPSEVAEAVHEHRADVLAISMSMPDQIPAVTSMIAAVRADARTQRAKVLVGGRPFAVAPDLVRAVGADAWAPDAASAAGACRELVEVT